MSDFLIEIFLKKDIINFMKNNLDKILIIRGWRSKESHWEKVKNVLISIGFKVLSPDLPGFNEEKLKTPMTIDDYAEWLLKYSLKEGWDKFILIGHSFGGAVAAKFVAKYPKRVKKLILVAPAVWGIKSLKNIFYYILAKLIKPIFIIPHFNKNKSRTKKRLSSFGIKDYYFESGVLAKTLRNLSKEDFKKVLENIKIETLIMWGGKDEKISVKYVKEIKKRIKKSKIIIFPKAGHKPYLETSEEFLKEIINFIKFS